MVKMMIKYPFDLEEMSETYWDEESFLVLLLFSFATFVNVVSFLMLLAAWIFLLGALFV